MDIQSAQTENPTVLTKPPSNPLSNKIFIYIAISLLFFSLGWIARPSLLPFGTLSIPLPSQIAKVNSPSPSPQSAIESKLPVSLSLLNNPIVYEWRGSVTGKITKKDDHTFTLVDEKGNSITIYDKMPSGDIFKAIFYDKANKNKKISLKDIPIGSLLLGDFFIFKGAPNTPVASYFGKQ